MELMLGLMSHGDPHQKKCPKESPQVTRHLKEGASRKKGSGGRGRMDGMQLRPLSFDNILFTFWPGFTTETQSPLELLGIHYQWITP